MVPGMNARGSIAVLRVVGILLLPLAVPPNAAGQCYYTYQQLPEPSGGWNFVGIDMNELGHVAGLMFNGGDFTRVGFWSPDTGIQFVPKPSGIRSMEVGGLNDHDVICGQMYDDSRYYGFLWDRGSNQVTSIDLPEGAYRVEMNAINNANQVAATLYYHVEPMLRAAFWYDGAFHPVADDPDIDPLTAYATNESGVTGGDAGSTQWGGARAFWANHPSITILQHPPGLTSTFCRSMSDNGGFGGEGWTAQGGPNFAYRGVVWVTGGDAHVVSPPENIRDAFVRDVNNVGRAVGETYRRISSPGPLPTALVWQQGIQTELNDLVPGLSRFWRAAAINGHGQVFADSAQGDFVLTPVWLPGDLTGDCHVSVEDLILVLSNFGMPLGSFPRGDVDLDGDVDLNDLTILLAHWGE